MQIDSPNILTQLNVSGSASITGSLNVSGTITASDIQGTATTASFIEYSNVANKPALVSGSSQITLSDTDGFTEYSGSVGTLINNLETASGSIRTDFNSYTSSADGRIGSLETYSSSLKTALLLDGANVTVLGNLEVSGTTTTIDSTTVDIGTNIIDLNGTGAVLAGLRVNDVTSPNTISGSLLWNSTTDRWIAGPSGSESNILLANGDGVVSGSSQISFNGITDKPSLVSGSSQIDHDATTNFVANEHIDHSTVSITAESGLSGGGTIASTRTLTLDTGSAHFTGGVKTKLNADGVISGSIQVDHDATTNFVANEHIDHSTVSISPGSGLSGGGTIAATRTLSVDSGSMLPFYSSSIFSSVSGDITINSSTGVATIAANSVALGTDTTGNYVGTITAGTGIDTTGATTGEDIAHTISVDVSDFMSNGADNRIVTATGTDAMNAEANLTFDGSVLFVSGSITVDNALLSNQQNLDVDSGATRVIATIPTGSYDAAFFDFMVKKGTNRRAGTVFAVHNGTTVEFTETSTNDIGSTTDVTLSADISAGNLRLVADTLTNDWIIKSLVRGL